MTLPYFLPMPSVAPSGAFIRLKEPISDRRKLSTRRIIRWSGPMLLLLDLRAEPRTVEVRHRLMPTIIEGNSLPYLGVKYLMFGQITAESLSPAPDVFISQIAFAVHGFGPVRHSICCRSVTSMAGHTVLCALWPQGSGNQPDDHGRARRAGAGQPPGLPELHSRSAGKCRLHGLVCLAGAAAVSLASSIRPRWMTSSRRLDTRRRLIGYLVIIIFIPDICAGTPSASSVGTQKTVSSARHTNRIESETYVHQPPSMQEVIAAARLLAAHGCSIWQPYGEKVGAGTTIPPPCCVCLGRSRGMSLCVEPSFRPDDGRRREPEPHADAPPVPGSSLKPDPGNPQGSISSLERIGLDRAPTSVRGGTTEPPALCVGLGWEVALDGREIVQFTYFQQSRPGVDPVSGDYLLA